MDTRFDMESQKELEGREPCPVKSCIALLTNIAKFVKIGSKKAMPSKSHSRLRFTYGMNDMAIWYSVPLGPYLLNQPKPP